MNLDESWLHERLQKQGISDANEVFFASINEERKLTTSLYPTSPVTLPTLKH